MTPRRRDPLAPTPRTLREADSTPWDWWEGPAEPSSGLVALRTPGRRWVATLRAWARALRGRRG